MIVRLDPTLSIHNRSDRYIWIGIGISLAIHALLLALHFTFPEASREIQSKALDIILVNSKSDKRPKDPQALAQANLDGGGDTKENKRAKSPLPEALKDQVGAEAERNKKTTKVVEVREERLTAKNSKEKIAPKKPNQEAPTEQAPDIKGSDLASSTLEMMRIRAEIAKTTEQYNQMPRVKNLGTRTAEYRFARYMEDWRLKIEKVGTLNYPSAAKGKIYGSLVLSVRIRADGSVERVEINRTSGQKILDDAAKRIVQLASPFASFPDDIKRDTDIIEITRVWNFTRDSALETKAR